MELRRTMKSYEVMGCLFILASHAGCKDSRAQRPNFVFFVLDTCRADHMSVYGYARETTPFLRKLGEDGLVFERARSQAPWTAPSMASIWTSRFPSEVGVQSVENADGARFIERHFVHRMDRERATLAERLSAHGYETIALVSNVYASRKIGLTRGFDEYAFRMVPARLMVDAAHWRLKDRRDKKKPFFLYVHLIDLHQPTRPPPPYDTMFPTQDGKPHAPEHHDWGYGLPEDWKKNRFGAFREHKLALYDGTMRFVDDQLQRFMSHLKQVGLAKNTITVIASDHGESFWDHAEFEAKHHLNPRNSYGVGHGQSMFAELLHVPLIIHGPGVGVPTERVAGAVRNLDIMPTVLSLAGIPTDDLGLRGVDLVANVRAGRVSPIPAFSEDIAYGHEAKSLEVQRYKLIRYEKTRSGRHRFLYDLKRDPTETSPLDPSAKPKVRRTLERALETILRGRRKSGAAEPLQPDGRTREALEALGYL